MRLKLYDGAVLQHPEDQTSALRVQLGFTAQDDAHARAIVLQGYEDLPQEELEVIIRQFVGTI